MSGLTVTDLVVAEPGAPLVVVDHLRVAAGEAVAVVGPGGSGKSLLAAGLAGFSPSTGSIVLGEVELVDRSPHARTRAGLASVSSSGPRRTDVLGGLTVWDHLELARRGRHVDRGRRWSRRSILAALPGLDRVLDAELSMVGAWERLATGLAAALRTEPVIVVLDEPLAGLAGAGGGIDRLRAALFRLTGSGVGVLLLTRDPVAAASLSHRVVPLADRHLVAPSPGAPS